MDPDGRKVYIEHAHPCYCWVDEYDAIYVVWPCQRRGHRVTKRRLAQLVHNLTKNGDK